MQKLVAVGSLAIILSLTASLIPAYAQTTSSSRFNWLQFCRNPIVDAAVTEPCETLTTPDGYELTPAGRHVVGCFLGGALLYLADPSGQALLQAQAIAPTVGCQPVGSSLGTPSSGGSQNPLGNILNGLLGR